MRRLAATLMVAIALILTCGSPAQATEPVTLGQGRVVDDAGVLSPAQLTAAEQRLATLTSDARVDLWVVFVDDFTSPSDAPQWAKQVATANGLGSGDFLLAVAVDSRQYFFGGDTDAIDDSALSKIRQNDIEPALGRDDWAGAIDGAASGMTIAKNGDPAAARNTGIAVGVIALLVLAVVVVMLLRARHRRVVAARAAAQTLAELGRRAAGALVQADDAVRAAQDELGFATAQFGEDATAEFQQALTDSQHDVEQAFRIRQQLDDEIPDTDEQRTAWHNQTLELAAAAQQRLAEKAHAFDELRNLANDAPAVLARLTDTRAKAVDKIAAAAAAQQRLTATYAPSALVAVADNPAQAQSRLDLADQQLAEARSEQAAGRLGPTAVALRAAEQALTQADQLSDAITSLEGHLTEAAQQLPALAAEVEKDVAAASALPDADAQSSVAAGRLALSRDRTGDPLAAVAALQEADTALDAALARAQEAAARVERARQLLPSTFSHAAATVQTAGDFVASRRGAVGATARTRLTEAQAALSQASTLTDPEQALAAAQRADQLATQALQSAQSDVSGFGSGGGGNNNGALLGGILIGSMLGGRGGGGFGGGGFGGFGGGGFGGGGGFSGGGGGGSWGGGGGRF